MKYLASLALFVISGLAFGLTPHERSQLSERANKGDSEAMYLLFVDIGERGGSLNKPSPQEYEEAIKWLLQAGELNNWRAAHVLQLCYSKGCWGLQPNAEKAAHFKDVYTIYGPGK